MANFRKTSLTLISSSGKEEKWSATDIPKALNLTSLAHHPSNIRYSRSESNAVRESRSDLQSNMSISEGNPMASSPPSCEQIPQSPASSYKSHYPRGGPGPDEEGYNPLRKIVEQAREQYFPDGKAMFMNPGIQPGMFPLQAWMFNPDMFKNYPGFLQQPEGPIRLVFPRIDSSGLPVIEWNKLELPPKQQLWKLLMDRINNYVKPDIEIVISCEIFSCHLMVLQCYSKYFENVAPSKRVRLPEDQVTPTAFHLLYDWMIYEGTDPFHILRRDNILQLLTASQFLGIEDVENQCWAFISSEAVFNEETAYLLFIEARKAKNLIVSDYMIPRIQKCFLKLVASEDFLELDCEAVCKLLNSHYIAVHKEMEVFMSAIRWLIYKREERQKHALDVMKCIRFGWIEPWQLIDIRRNPINPPFLQMTEQPDVKSLIDDGLAYSTTKFGYGQEPGKLESIVHSLDLDEPKPRNWLEGSVSYTIFQDFLDDLPIYHMPNAMSVLEIRRDGTSNLTEALFKDPVAKTPKRGKKESLTKVAKPLVIEREAGVS